MTYSVFRKKAPVRFAYLFYANRERSIRNRLERGASVMRGHASRLQRQALGRGHRDERRTNAWPLHSVWPPYRAAHPPAAGRGNGRRTSNAGHARRASSCAKRQSPRRKGHGRRALARRGHGLPASSRALRCDPRLVRRRGAASGSGVGRRRQRRATNCLSN